MTQNKEQENTRRRNTRNLAEDIRRAKIDVEQGERRLALAEAALRHRREYLADLEKEADNA
jgi:hypothetical protein